MRTKVPKMATDPVKKRIVGAIQDSEFRMESELKVLKMAAMSLRDAKNKYHIAFFACRRKDTVRNSDRYERASEALRSAESVFLEADKRIDETLSIIEGEYNRLMNYTTPAVTSKLRDELEIYKLTVEEKRRRFCKGIAEPESSSDLYPDELSDDGATSIKPASSADDTVAGTARVASVSIAPVAIDISSHVEKAISATMDAFSRRMERKIDEYFEARVINYQRAVENAPDGENTDGGAPAFGNLPLEGGNTSPETTATVAVSQILNELRMVTAECAAIAEKQAEIAELQRQINEMQRQTMRDQKGLQVSQRVLATDQGALANEQESISERQKNTAKEAESVAKMQAEALDVQMKIADEHARLAAATAECVRIQGEIGKLQANVNSGNSKNVELARTLTALQSELTAAQKQAVSEQRQLLREQRARDKRRSGREASGDGE